MKPRTNSSRAATVALLFAALWAPAAAAEVHTVNVVNFAFEPADLTIQVGDTVTWVNGGGLHNVAADDGNFLSGPPSTDLWIFSQTFNFGDVIPFHCDQHPILMTGTITVEGIFGDFFESGDADSWSSSTLDMLPGCSCYFSGDCAAGFCDWGVLTNQDNCIWKQNKPNGVPGAGCDVAYVGPWIGGICDGICSASAQGSRLGWEERALIEEGTRLWAEALLQPAEAGGGPVDPKLAEQAQALAFKTPDAAFALGRQVADLLVVAGIPGFADHFCHFEGHPGELDPGLWVDLSNDPCRRVSARRAVDALLAELHEPGSGGRHLVNIRVACFDWQGMFAPRCAAGPDALACVAERIANLAVFLNTPRNFEAYLQEILAHPLSSEKP
ncbi:MAG: plastocyanin/azurin family copper-binding protein [Thermoanaerobaculia bacterium]